MLTIISIIVLIGVSILITWVRNKANKALAQKVFERGKHQRGQIATKENIVFFTPGTAADVVSTVLDTLDLARVPGGLVAQLYIVGTTKTSIVFGFGNKLVQSFRTALVAEDLPQGGSKSTYSVLNWVEGDGIVRGIAELELLANSIRACAAQLGGSFTAQPVAAPDAQPDPVPAALPVVAPNEAFCASCGSPELGERFCTDCGAVRV